MTINNSHYKQIARNQHKTKFASCGYDDRFDPFKLNKNKYVKNLYSSLFQSYLPSFPVDRLLDVGCGTGIYFDTLVKYAKEIKAIDLSDDMIKIASDYCVYAKLSSIIPKTGSAESLEYADNYFDVVIAFDYIHHTINLKKALKEIYRVLKPGGKFLVFEPNIYNPLMFLAHIIPKEERMALGRSSPAKLIAALERQFDLILWEGVCVMVTQSSGIRKKIFDTYLKICKLSGLKKLYPRQIVLAQKL